MATKSRLRKTFETLNAVNGITRSIYWRAKEEHLTSRQVIDQYVQKVMKKDLYWSLPEWARREINGYQRGMHDALWDWLEDRWELDGVQYTQANRGDNFDGQYSRVQYVGKWYPGTQVRFDSTGS